MPMDSIIAAARSAGEGTRGYRGQSWTERFWSKVTRDKTHPGEGHWHWTGSTFAKSGYGQFWALGRNWLAHRVAKELLEGREVGELVNLCGRASCVNPDHWAPLSESGVRSSRAGEAHARAKLNNSQARDIYRRAMAGEESTALAQEFGVHISTISLIKAGKRYAAATEDLRHE